MMGERDGQLVERFATLKRRYVERDRRMSQIRAVRQGEPELVFEGLFPEDWPKPIIANFIDVVAQDTAEMVGVMPTLSAEGDSVLDDSKRSRADKLTKIAAAYPTRSKLGGTRLVQAADRMNTYGFVAFRAEPVWEEQRIHIHVDDPVGAYPEFDRFGNVVTYAKSWTEKASKLAKFFPEFVSDIMPKQTGFRRSQSDDSQLTIVQWWDRDRCVLFLPDRDGLVLAGYENPISRVPVAIAVRPSLDDEQRGAYDDALWVYAAKARLAILSMEAVQKSVEAPIAIPDDVQEMAFGPDAIIRTAQPQMVRRVPLELPQSAMIENRVLEDELRFGTRFPQARAGEVDGNVVTGKGVEALLGGFDSRIKVAQSALGGALEDIVSICLEYDEAIWPDVERTVKGSTNGTPYEVRYKPSRDIKGQYNVSAEYGVMAGLDPNRALIWALQAMGAGLVSKSFTRRNMPVSLNIQEEERVIDIEKLRDAALASIQSYAQSIPQVAATGGDPVEAVNVLAQVIEARKKGVSIEDAIAKAFTPKEPPQGEVEEPGLPGMVEPSPAGPPPGGAPQQDPGIPPMQQLMAGLTGSGRPIMAGRVVRQTPV